jgi:uncharacterized protein YeaO (DUF488 family)
MTNQGKLYTSNLVGLKKKDFEADVLLITRAGAEINNLELMRELAPSSDLFQTFLELWKGSPGEDWWPKYKQRFLLELNTPTKKNALLNVLSRLQIGKNVVVVCFCQDHRYCHRSLVGEYFKNNEIEVEELDPILYEQLRLF